MKKLSIIIPVYNEEKSVDKLLRKVLSVKFPVRQIEYIVIDDGSTDNTLKKITELKSRKLQLLLHKNNKGKGVAVQTGFKAATGDYIIIQDADLEYNPSDILKLLKPILQEKAQVVYGTRLKRLPNFKRDERTPRFLLQYIGNKLLSFTTSILYFQWITDMESCYKLFPREALKGVHLYAKTFDFEPEITAKLLKKGYKILEIPISTNPRGYKEGKKLHPIPDGTKALWTLLKYRFID